MSYNFGCNVLLKDQAQAALLKETGFSFNLTSLAHHRNLYEGKFISRQKMKNMGYHHFNLKVCPPMDPENHVNCILIGSIYTIYVSGKLDPGVGEHSLKLKTMMTLLFQILTRNNFLFLNMLL